MLDLAPLDPGIELSVASRGMSKGIAQTEGPQLIVKPFVKLGDFQVGAQWKNVTSTVAGGEGAVFVAFGREVGGFQLTLQASHKFQTGVHEPTDDHSWEFTGGLTRKLGSITLRGQVVYSPDDLGSAKRSLYWEAGPAVDVSKQFKLFANIGHRARKFGDDYTSFNAGASTTIVPKVTLDLRWYDTNRHELGENFHGRAVVTARMAF
ncbi:hypothetical protein LZ518_06525 [Sphingomonas sp. RB56-2]|uniref:Porin n=1 Tax=Sphingomonas brevis TaxID=2908206 RepID=A0ABT0S8X3_9SPHN|nr:hypothetical protein [Sphingomonas brevis]MCL6740787.1 hypothetical protein [Sphingomonas brevis]